MKLFSRNTSDSAIRTALRSIRRYRSHPLPPEIPLPGIRAALPMCPGLPMRRLPPIMSAPPGTPLPLPRHSRGRLRAGVLSSRRHPETVLLLPFDSQRHLPVSGDRRIPLGPLHVRLPGTGLPPIPGGQLPLPQALPRSGLPSRDAVSLRKKPSALPHSRDGHSNKEPQVVPLHREQHPGLYRSRHSASPMHAAESTRRFLLPVQRFRRRSSGEKNGIIPFCGSYFYL